MAGVSWPQFPWRPFTLCILLQWHHTTCSDISKVRCDYRHRNPEIRGGIPGLQNSQGSVATCARCGGIFDIHLTGPPCIDDARRIRPHAAILMDRALACCTYSCPQYALICLFPCGPWCQCLHYCINMSLNSSSLRAAVSAFWLTRTFLGTLKNGF